MPVQDFTPTAVNRLSSSSELTRSTPMSDTEARILKAIAKHRVFPSAQSIAEKVRGLNAKKVLDARKANLRIRRAWDAKTVELVMTIHPRRLFDYGVVLRFVNVQGALQARHDRIVKRIKEYRGRPTIYHLAKYVTCNRTSKDFLTNDEMLERAAVGRIIALLKPM
ncbi:MAG: hypothetical protein Q8R15_03825 [Candidatus Micrarchaeota archaeon]|nr:hypothetical protein [Candidatus Micrarchaeota archaeon]